MVSEEAQEPEAKKRKQFKENSKRAKEKQEGTCPSQQPGTASEASGNCADGC